MPKRSRRAAFIRCLDQAIDLGGEGRVVAGYDLLLAGLERERARGVPEQVPLWETACLRYAERFGPRLESLDEFSD